MASSTSRADAGTSSGDTEGDFCECLESQPKVKSCQFGKPCQSDADCCTQVPAGFTCNDYPYNSKCVAGECAAAECENASQCLAYIENLKKTVPQAELKGCEDASPCGFGYFSCTFTVSCQTDADCCPDTLPEGYTCNDYPYLYKCSEGLCTTKTCESDEQCTHYYEELLKDQGFQTKGCHTIDAGCFGTVKQCFNYLPCQTDADCCPDTLPEGFTCNDYPYISACKDGACTTVPCSADNQCVAYAQKYAEPAGLVLKGCK